MTNKKNKANLLNEQQIQKTLIRLAHEIVEKNSNLDHLVIIGIRIMLFLIIIISISKVCYYFRCY